MSTTTKPMTIDIPELIDGKCNSNCPLWTNQCFLGYSKNSRPFSPNCSQWEEAVSMRGMAILGMIKNALSEYEERTGEKAKGIFVSESAEKMIIAFIRSSMSDLTQTVFPENFLQTYIGYNILIVKDMNGPCFAIAEDPFKHLPSSWSKE